MIIGIVTSILLVPICILIHYETFRILSLFVTRAFLDRLARAHRGRRSRLLRRPHDRSLGLYRWFYLLADRFVLNGVAGVQPLGFADLVYFSVVTYSTIGIGDLFPVGAARLITGVEAIVGLLLLGWSATFTYLVMGRVLAPSPSARHGISCGTGRKSPFAPRAGLNR